MSFLYLLLCEDFLLLFKWLATSFLVIIFSFLRRTLYNTWKSHYRQLQVLIRFKLLWKFPASLTERNHSETFWVFRSPPTGFWECWGQKCFGSLGEWHKSEFSGKHPWRSAISEKVRGIAPWPPFVLSPGFILRIIADVSKIVCRIVFKLLAKLWKHLVFTKRTFPRPVKSRCDI